jgi:hypothetical protein
MDNYAVYTKKQGARPTTSRWCPEAQARLGRSLPQSLDSWSVNEEEAVELNLISTQHCSARVRSAREPGLARDECASAHEIEGTDPRA